MVRLRRFARMRARGSRVRQSCGLAILFASLVVVAPGQSSARTPRPAGHHRLHRHIIRHAAPQPLRLRLPAADDFSNAGADGRDVAIGAPFSIDDRPSTSIDYRLAPRGPIGSVGLLRHPGGPQGLAPTNGPSSSLRRGYPEVNAGAKLSYPF